MTKGTEVKGQFGVKEKDIPKLIDVVSKVSKNPSFDLVVQAVENAMDVMFVDRVRERTIRIYRTELCGMPSLIVEDTGCGMNREMMDNYRDIMGSIKKWSEAAGFIGIGRFAYITRAQAGVFIETHYMDGRFSDWAYAFVDKNRNECVFRSEYPEYDNWKYYKQWLRESAMEELRQGTRVLLWYVDEAILKDVLENGRRWIARQFGDKLGEVELYFEGERVQAKPPPHRWHKNIDGDAISVEGRPVTGHIVLCNQPLEDPGIAIRAINRTISYSMFDLTGFEKLQQRVWGWIDVSRAVSREMITPAKDEILDGPVRREIWKRMRDLLRNTLGEWEERLEAKHKQKVKGALKEIRNRLHDTLKTLEQSVDAPLDEEVEPPHPELARKDEGPPKERDGLFLCNSCGEPLARKPDRTGIVTTLQFLRTPCPHCGNPYKARAHRSALGKNYRLYICGSCRHHVLYIDKTRFGFDLEIQVPWQHDPEKEFVWESKLLVNGEHVNFKEANNDTRRATQGRCWPTIVGEELDHTPLEHHILNCAASGYAINELGKKADTSAVIMEIARFKSVYYSVKMTGRGRAKRQK